MPPARHLWQVSSVVVVVLLAAACRSGQPTTNAATTGAQLYAINCSTCHGPSGKGLGDYPKLIGVADILGGDYARTVVAEGRNLMPSFGSKLTAQQIDEIVDYVATFKN